MKVVKILMSLSLIGVILFGCKKETVSTYDCTGTTPTYTADIKTILNASCAFSGCHDATSKKSGYDFSTYDAAKSGSQKAAFLGSIEHKSGYDAMPKNSGKLTDATIKKLACWVQNGSPN